MFAGQPSRHPAGGFSDESAKAAVENAADRGQRRQEGRVAPPSPCGPKRAQATGGQGQGQITGVFFQQQTGRTIICGVLERGEFYVSSHRYFCVRPWVLFCRTT